MAVITPLNLALPALPSSYSLPTPSTLSPPSTRTAYPAGPSYLASARRQLLQRTFAEDDAAVQAHLEALRAQQASDAGETLFPGLGEEEESAALLQNDPKEWKKQDHYAVLGLGGLRYKATDEHIKVAHRRKVLRHHPDKKAGSKTIAHTGTNDDAFFKCIQKAHETLTNPERRRQFDSVDWNIEDEVPDLRSIPADKFCAVVAPIFAREGRFSNVQPVAPFGDDAAPKSVVEGFYDFWYNFDSWRSFEWHDKEVNEGSDSRDDKRFTEKKNKTERARRKKEDNVRVRELVDAVLAVDPRIKRIKEEEKAARLAKKNGGKATPAANGSGKSTPAAATAQLTPAQKKAAEAAKKEEERKALEVTKGDRVAAKKAKEAARKNLKKWKKSISTIIASSNYFQPPGTAPSAAQIDAQLTELDALVELLEPEEVKDLKEKVEAAGAGEGAKVALVEKVQGLGGKGEGRFKEFA